MTLCRCVILQLFGPSFSSETAYLRSFGTGLCLVHNCYMFHIYVLLVCDLFRSCTSVYAQSYVNLCTCYTGRKRKALVCCPSVCLSVRLCLFLAVISNAAADLLYVYGRKMGKATLLQCRSKNTTFDGVHLSVPF